MSTQRPKVAGFTLIELMIVVAIIGILAALAIPNFVRLQLRTKSAEGRLNLAGIRKAEDGYFAEVGVFLAWSSTPNTAGSPPGSAKTEWGVACSFPPASTAPGFCLIGWEPEGQVYFNYAVATNGSSSLTGAQYFAAAEADLDGDGALNLWGIKRPDNSGSFLSVGPFGCVDVVNPATGGPMMGQVGPCDEPTNGINVF